MALKKDVGGVEDLALGMGTRTQLRNGREVTITEVNSGNVPYSDTQSTKEAIEQVDAKHQSVRNDLDAHKSADNPHNITPDMVDAEPKLGLGQPHQVLATNTNADGKEWVDSVNASDFVRKAGDTMTGNLLLPNDGIIVGHATDYEAGANHLIIADRSDDNLIGLQAKFFTNAANDRSAWLVQDISDSVTAINKSKLSMTNGVLEFAGPDNTNHIVWHEGNFNPDDKLDKSGDDMSGNLTVHSNIIVGEADPGVGSDTNFIYSTASSIDGLTNYGVRLFSNGELGIGTLALQDITDTDNKVQLSKLSLERDSLIFQASDKVDKAVLHEGNTIDISAGATDGGKGIRLNSNGVIDVSMLETSTFTPVGSYDPSAGTEYPDTTGVDFGGFWYIDELTNPTGTSPEDYYTFTSGDLNTKSIRVGDFMVWAATGWGIMAGEMNPVLYMKLDKSQHLDANSQPLVVNGKVTYVDAGTVAGEAIEYDQWSSTNTNQDTEIAGKVNKSGDTMTGTLTVDVPDLGQVTGDTAQIINATTKTSNGDTLEIRYDRIQDGTDWDSADLVLQRRIDSILQGFIKMTHDKKVQIGYNNTPFLTVLDNGDTKLSGEFSANYTIKLDTNLTSGGTQLFAITNFTSSNTCDISLKAVNDPDTAIAGFSFLEDGNIILLNDPTPNHDDNLVNKSYVDAGDADKVIEVATVDDLLNLSGQDGDSVLVTQPKRGDVFNFSSTAGPNDNGVTFNGWVREFDGGVNVNWFNAKGDGSDSTQAFLDAANYVNNNQLGTNVEKSILVTDGSHLIEATPELPKASWEISASAEITGLPPIDDKYDDTSRLLGIVYNYTNKKNTENHLNGMMIGNPFRYQEKSPNPVQALFGSHATDNNFAVRATATSGGIGLAGYGITDNADTTWGMYLEGISVPGATGNAFGTEITIKNGNEYPDDWHPYGDQSMGRKQHIRLTTGSSCCSYEEYDEIPEPYNAGSYMFMTSKGYYKESDGTPIVYPPGHPDEGEHVNVRAEYGFVFKNLSCASGEMIIAPYDYKVVNYINTKGAELTTFNTYRDGRTSRLVTQSNDLLQESAIEFVKTKEAQLPSGDGDGLGKLQFRAFNGSDAINGIVIDAIQVGDIDTTNDVVTAEMHIKGNKSGGTTKRGLKISHDEVSPTNSTTISLGTTEALWSELHVVTANAVAYMDSEGNDLVKEVNSLKTQVANLTQALVNAGIAI